MSSPANACDCLQVIENLSRFLEREVPDAERAIVDQHLAGCPACQQSLGTFRDTLRMCRQAAAPGVDSDCLKRAAEAARAELARRGLL